MHALLWDGYDQPSKGHKNTMPERLQRPVFKFPLNAGMAGKNPEIPRFFCFFSFRSPVPSPYQQTPCPHNGGGATVLRHLITEMVMHWMNLLPEYQQTTNSLGRIKLLSFLKILSAL